MNNLPKVQLRGGFSDRNQIKEENKTIQLNSFDERTRIAICNVLTEAFNDISELNERIGKKDEFEQIVCKHVLETVYAEQVNHKDRYKIDVFFDNYLYRTIKEDTFNSVLDLVEFFAVIDKLAPDYFEYKKYEDRVNDAFEYDFVGYRFVSSKIVAITDKNEIKAIEEAIIDNPYKKSKEHFSKALVFLADRNVKDYSNSIKESICAVESVCQIIVGKNTSLGKALEQLEIKGVKINPALKNAFDKMYGYATDEGGIRHANAFNDNFPAFEEAKFMLVACSAFVNYLISKISTTKSK